MSLITFKDGVMVGDKRGFLGDLYDDETTKVFSISSLEKSLIVGGAGSISSILEVVEWLKSGMTGSYPDSQAEATVITYNGDVLLRYCGSHIPIEYPADKPFADGPDMAVGIALGTMISGKTAKEANLLAQKMTIVCGGGVDTIEL